MDDLRHLGGGGIGTAQIVAAPASGSQRERRYETVSVVRVRRALHHLIVFQRVPGQAGLAIPILYLAEPNGDGTEELRPLLPLIGYFKANRARSASWMLEHARGTGMLFDYMIQLGPSLEMEATSSGLKFEHCLIRGFFTHVMDGTISPEIEAIADGTALYWPFRSRTAAMKLVRAVSDFVNYIIDNGDHDRLRPSPSSGVSPTSGSGMTAIMISASNGKKYGMLAHVKHDARGKSSGAQGIFGLGAKDLGAPDCVQFPRHYLAPLIMRGFRPSGSPVGTDRAQENATARLMTIMIAVYGSRTSEVLHLWVHDVQSVNGLLEVFLQHPEHALVTVQGHSDRTRATYLRETCGMEPRTSRLAGKYRAGWKGVSCNAQFWTVLYPLPIKGLHEFVSRELEDYIFRVRPAIMRKRLELGLPDHPFLLVSPGCTDPQDGFQTFGDPYTRSAFRKAWSAALRRLRTEFVDPRLEVLKRFGTTPHGLRHHYGSLLRELGVSPEMIQRFMHQLSPFSQQTYTKPRSSEINDVLNHAMNNMAAVPSAGAYAAFDDLNAMLDGIRRTRGARR